MILAIWKGRIIGDAGSVPRFGQSHTGEIFYGVLKEERGTGLIYALLYCLLNSINYRIIYANVIDINVKSEKVLEKIGARKVCSINDTIEIRGNKYGESIFLGDRITMRDNAFKATINKGVRFT